MFRFFSKIRNKLAAGQAGRVAKYLPYAIGEFPVNGPPCYLAIFPGWLVYTDNFLCCVNLLTPKLT